MPNRTPPKIIYHYTTQDGLLGILRESALWATKIQYLNDTSELIEAMHVADTMVTQFLRQLDIDDIKDKEEKKEIALRILDDIRDYEHTNICVASFCARGDLLSQWRGYGVSGSAYSIGFDREMLVKTIDPYPFRLHPCEYYEPTEYRRNIQEFIMHIIEEARINLETLVDFIGRFVEMAATMKFKYFEEEDEWRIVSSKPINFSDEKFDFRPSKSMVIPYYCLPLNLSSIVEIVVGPSLHPELAKNAIYGLAHRFNLEAVKRGQVKMSQIPYRFS